MADRKPTERHEDIQFRRLFDEAVTKPAVASDASGTDRPTEVIQ